MSRKLLVISVLGALALALVAAAFGRAQATTLNGTVGPGYTITLKKGTKKVTSLKAGSYRFVIADKANIHNFVVEQEKGGKFEKTLTGISFKGKKTVTLKLKAGRYKYYCKPHESSMHGFFTVK
jgi:plastocyanin